MVSFLTDFAKTCVERLINVAIEESRYLFCFTCIAKEFEEEKTSLEAERKTLEQRAKVAIGRDKDIQANVLFWEEEVGKLIQEDIKTKKTWFFGLCPNCIWRYKRGKDLANKIEEIKGLTEKVEKFENIELPRPLPDVERYSSEKYISFKSRESKNKELLDAIKDDNNYITGLQGMGGTGKTTLAKKVGKDLKHSEQFTHVIDTTVSFTPDIKKIQDDIAGPLGLKWEDCNNSDRPGKLWSRLTNGEKILLILDDVWDQNPHLDFDLIGIPKQDNQKGCRILITTRSKQILNKLDCCKTIELELLSEEDAWSMFIKYAGISDSISKNLMNMGRKIAKECKGLPVAIAAIASSLKGQQDRNHEWDVALKSLKKQVSTNGVDDDLVGIYKCLKFSYDYMKDKKVKGLFLLSSVFPEDKEIPIEILTRLGIGIGLFGEDCDSYDDARKEVVVAINVLIDSCLLLKVGEGHVKLHDLVREAAQWIANKEIQCVNLSDKVQKSSVQREINIKYLFCEGKDVDLFLCKFDGSKLETLIVDMNRDEDRNCMEIPNSFFENIAKLRVLYFSYDKRQPLSLLPYSIQALTNIRSMLVDGVDLGDISVLGNLQSLETIDLTYCRINELPHELTNLGKFKLLKLEFCVIRRKNPFEVIEKCSSLEELYFIDGFNEFCQDITFPKLQRYHIRTRCAKMNDSLSKYVSFDGTCPFSKETLKYCMQTSEALQLNGFKGEWTNLMPEMVPIDIGMNDLIELCLSSISQLQCLIDTINSQAPNVFSKLAVLELNLMKNLKELFSGSISPESLKNLEKLEIIGCTKFQRLFNCKLNLCNLKLVKLDNCPKLVSLFPLSICQNLVMLEELRIYDCEGLKSIIIDEIRVEESIEEVNDGDNDINMSHGSMFPKLKVLDIEKCHQLESILPLLSSQVLEVIKISSCDKLKYIFDQHVDLGSLKEIILSQLPNFVDIFSNNSHSIPSVVKESSFTSKDSYKSEIELDTIKCSMFSWTCICCHGNKDTHKLKSTPTTGIPMVSEDSLQDCSKASVSKKWEHVQCLPIQTHIMCNIREITLSGFMKIKSMFILSVAQRMLVESMTILDCDELKHIIVDTGDHDHNGGNNWGNVFPKLKKLYIGKCKQLEYIFGDYDDDYQNNTEIHIHLPALQSISLENLPSLVSMCPNQYRTTFPFLNEVLLTECSQNAHIKSIGEFISQSVDSTIMKVSNMHHHQLWERALCFSLQSHIMCNIKEITLSNILKIKSVFILSVAQRMLVESLRIMDCDELKHIIVDTEDHDHNGGNNWGNVFPKLKKLWVEDCKKLEYIFGDYDDDDYQNNTEIHIHLPALQSISLENLPCLVSMCPNQYRATFPSLNEVLLTECSENAHIKSIGEFISQSVDNTIVKELNGSAKHFIALESIKVDNSKVENILCLNTIDEQEMNLRLQEIELYDMDDMRCLFVGPNNSFSLQNLTFISIVRCVMLEIVFSTSILRCLPQLVSIRIVGCRGLKHIIEDENMSKSLSLGTCFPKLTSLLVEYCYNLECIFPVSICKEFPELKVLMIRGANEMKEIFKSESDQKVKIPKLKYVVLVNLPNLFHTQGVQFQTIENRFIQNCQNLSFTSALTPQWKEGIYNLGSDGVTLARILGQFQQLEDEYDSQDTGNENPKVEPTKDFVGVEGTLEHKSTSSEIQTPEAEHEPVCDLEKPPSDAILQSKSQELVNEESTNQHSLMNEQESSHGNNCLKEKDEHSIEESYMSENIVASTISTISEIRNETPIQKEQDVDIIENLDTTKTNDDQVSQNNDAVIKVSSTIEEQFPKDDEFRVSKSKPSPSNSIPLPLAFQTPSMPSKGNPSLVMGELEQLVSMNHLDYKNMSLLTDFLVKNPSILLRENSLSSRYKGYAYNCLAELLKFLQTHSALDVLGSSNSEFVELLQDVRRFSFDKGWLDGVEKRALFPDVQFSQDALQKLLDSKKQVTKDVELTCLKIEFLTQNVEDLKHHLTSSKDVLENIIQQEAQILESKAALSVPLGY